MSFRAGQCLRILRFTFIPKVSANQLFQKVCFGVIYIDFIVYNINSSRKIEIYGRCMQRLCDVKIELKLS